MIRSRASSERYIHTNFLARQNVKRSGGAMNTGSAAMISMGVSLLTCLFVFLWVKIYIIEVGYRLSNVHQLHTQLVQENGKLKIARAELSSPERIERIARQKLGMVSPANDQMVVIRW